MSPSRLPLPDGCAEPAWMIDDVLVGAARIARAGVSVQLPSGVELVGAAASTEEAPRTRAAYELLERAATQQAAETDGLLPLCDERGVVLDHVASAAVFPRDRDGARTRLARSNGVALHDTFAAAARRARAELVERHRVLRSWYGGLAPRRVELPAGWRLLTEGPPYDWRAYAFDQPAEEIWGAGLEVRGVFGFPLRGDLPACVGYGCRERGEDALAAACAEAVQSLAFLWGEELPTTLADPAPGPACHLDRLLYPDHHAVLRAWLERGHAHHGEGEGSARPEHRATPVRYADLTPPWLGEDRRVVRALHPGAEPLVFGVARAARHLPPRLSLHPVP